MQVKVRGEFEVHDFGVLLVIPLDKQNFDKLREHVNLNMFFSYKRLADRFKRIALLSVGDHIDVNGNQVYKEADVCIDVKNVNRLSREEIDILEKARSWHIHAVSGNESYLFSIDKDTQFIVNRMYYPDRNII